MEDAPQAERHVERARSDGVVRYRHVYGVDAVVEYRLQLSVLVPDAGEVVDSERGVGCGRLFGCRVHVEDLQDVERLFLTSGPCAASSGSLSGVSITCEACRSANDEKRMMCRLSTCSLLMSYTSMT